MQALILVPFTTLTALGIKNLYKPYLTTNQQNYICFKFWPVYKEKRCKESVKNKRKKRKKQIVKFLQLFVPTRISSKAPVRTLNLWEHLLCENTYFSSWHILSPQQTLASVPAIFLTANIIYSHDPSLNIYSLNLACPLGLPPETGWEYHQFPLPLSELAI